jgi:uncharacterized caspase-like protein
MSWFSRSGRAIAVVIACLVLHVASAEAQIGSGPIVGEGNDAGRRVALVIGNGAYENAPALPNPPNDARRVAESLRGLGFEVMERFDRNYAAMQTTLGEFADKLQGAKVGLFFYAGHALQVAGENYLVPVNAKLEREAQLTYQAVTVQAVLRIMEAEVPTRLVLLDACRDNPLARTLARSMGGTRSTMVGQGLAGIQAGVGTLIAYATAPGEVAFDGAGQNSPFTTALLEHIASPGLEVRQVLSRVRGSVLDMTDNRQVPWDSSSLRGDFYFVPRLVEPPQQVPAPSSAAPAADNRAFELAFWQSIQNSADPADFEAYLARFPDGIYAALARNRLARLKASQQAALPPAVEALPPTLPQVELEKQIPIPASPPQSRAPVTDCDRLAADPTDGQRVSGEVWTAEIDPARAEPACKEAVRQWPYEPRFQSQYGRVLAKQGNNVEALHWTRKAAEQGSASAQTNLGMMYYIGHGGLASDEAEALRWFRKAAEQGSASAQAWLGSMYEQGRGGLAEDKVEAVRWYRKAAEQGFDAARSMLELSYMRGLRGLGEVEPALRDTDWREVQRALAALGYAPGPADGTLNLRTREALATWQKVRGRESLGILRPGDREALVGR